MSAGEGKPLPPGRGGLPFIGETLKVFADQFAFVERGICKHGPVFRTKVLGRPTAVMAGPEASEKFIDPSCVQRTGAMPAHVEVLFGGKCLPVLDGDIHRERKHFVMAGFSREALVSYVPVLQKLVRGTLERWSQGGEMRWQDELERLSLESICQTVLGLAPGPVTEQLQRDYQLVGMGFTGLPIPLPGTKFSRAKSALARILAVFDAAIRDHYERPRDDGLSRILAARSPLTGRTMTVEEAKTELNHVIVAGLIVWAWLVTAVIDLGRNPQMRQRLQGEIDELESQQAGPLDLARLDGMAYLNMFSMEVRRTSPVVGTFFGKARKTFAFAGHCIPAGWSIFWGIRSSHMRPEIYTDPERFDPERFSPGRREHERHPHAFVPNGAGDAETGHKCAGYEFAPYFLKIFIVELLRGYTWRLSPSQDLAYDFGHVPPAPRDGLKAEVSARGGGEAGSTSS